MSTTRRFLVRYTGDRCEVCHQRHALDLEYRCVGCDRGVCALCVVYIRERSEAFCDECRPPERRPTGPEDG